MVYETNSLAHWGVKGMHWGVRRYQNADGSLTAAGKKRRLKEANADAKKKAKQAKESKEAATKKKTVNDMSDDELNRAIRRAQTEEQYKELQMRNASVGKKIADNLADKVVVPAVLSAGRKVLENALNKFGDKMLDKTFKDVVDPSSIDALTKTRDKLKLQEEIDKLRNPDKYTSWDDKIKEQTYNKNKRAEEEKARTEEADSSSDTASTVNVSKSSNGRTPSRTIPEFGSNTKFSYVKQTDYSYVDKVIDKYMSEGPSDYMKSVAGGKAYTESILRDDD